MEAPVEIKIVKPEKKSILFAFTLMVAGCVMTFFGVMAGFSRSPLESLRDFGFLTELTACIIIWKCHTKKAAHYVLFIVSILFVLGSMPFADYFMNKIFNP